MVVEIKVGRRLNTKGNMGLIKGTLNKARNVVSIQQYLWRTIQYGFNVASVKADIENRKKKKRGVPIDFNYSKKKFTEKEEDDMFHEIEWLKIKISSTEEIEEEQYQKSLLFFEQLKNHKILQRYINDTKDTKDSCENVDDSLKKIYNPKNKRIKKYLKKGLEGAGDQTLNKFLNEVGIIVFVNKS